MHTGTLGGALQSLTDLQYLNLSMNAFSGALPYDWSFPQLRVLNLTNNHLGGRLPSGACTKAPQPAVKLPS